MRSPEHVLLTISTGCNYKCVFCVNDALPEKTFLSMEKILELEDLIDGAVCVDISGYGEIIMHPQFKTIVRMLAEKKKQVSFSTNGSLLTKDIIDFLDTSSVHLLNISVNSLHPSTYKKITQTGNLGVLLNNLHYLLSQPRPYQITLSMVATSYAIHELSTLIRFSAEHGKHMVRFLALAPSLSYPKDLVLADTPENRQHLADADALAKELGVPLQSFGLDPIVPKDVGAARDKCQAFFTQILIGSNGNVAPCCWLPKMSMGNLKTQSWKEIWESDKYQELRQSVLNGNSEYCRHCREFG